jgi:hypothetical protein
LFLPLVTDVPAPGISPKKDIEYRIGVPFLADRPCNAAAFEPAA